MFTKRWHKATLSPKQLAYINAKTRTNVVVAGRRSFKTEGAKRRLIRAAVTFNSYADGMFWAAAPTHQQAKRIFWKDLKLLTPTWALKNGSRSISDSELTIQLINGAQINVVGLDKPERIEGKDWDGGVITEFGRCKKTVFGENIRPMLMRGGYVDIEGVPEGRNHYYDLAMAVRQAQAEQVDASEQRRFKNSSYHTWTTEEVLHLWLGKERAAEEIAEAMATLDTQVYNQEYKAQFISFEGRAYYGFTDDNKGPCLYDPERPLILAFDFNRSPGVCVYLQELPRERLPWLTRSRGQYATAVIGEVYIETGSNTPKVCERVLADWHNVHHGEVRLYGDPAGGAKTTQSIAGSDWDIIEEYLKPKFGRRLRNFVASGPPRIRTRVNAMNSRLLAADGSIAFVVDPSKAPKTVRDLEGVESDAAGDLIKESGGPLTHLTDAIGYYMHEEHPVSGPSMKVRY